MPSNLIRENFTSIKNLIGVNLKPELSKKQDIKKNK